MGPSIAELRNVPVVLPFVVISLYQVISLGDKLSFLAPTWRLFTAIGQSQLDANLWYAQKLGEEIVDPKIE